MPQLEPLARALETAGAVTGTRENVQVVTDFGDARVESVHVRRAPGVADLGFRGRIELTGADRLKFLHGQCTNEVAALCVGQGHSAFVLDHRGHNLAAISYVVQGERVLVRTGANAAPLLLGHWSRYAVIEDVALVDVEERLDLLLLAGPGSRAILESLLPEMALPREEDHGASGRWEGVPVVVTADRETGEQGFALWSPVAASGALLGALLSSGARPFGYDALDLLRTEAGRPWHGRDYEQDCLPAETGDEERRVSYQKGCYLGQEQVAKQHFRGRPRKMVRGLLPEGSGVREGDRVTLEGATLGTLTTVHDSSTLGRTLCLALLKGIPEIGTQVLVEPTDARPSVRASIVRLPFLRGDD